MIQERMHRLMNEVGLTIVRIGFGAHLAILHGWGKFPIPSPRFVEGVAEMGFPAPAFFAFMAGLSEFLGGILLALGIATRPAALLVGTTMFVAAFFAHADDPWARKELALLYLLVAICFLLAGGGRFSGDRFVWELWKNRSRKKGHTP